MADTAIAITAGTGTNVDTRTEATNGNHRQVVVLGDPSTNAGVAPVDATAGLKVDLGADNDVTIASLPALASGTNNIGDVDVLTINGVAPAFGSGVRGATVQRVTIATDDSVPVTGTFYQATQPVSAASLPLPTGASTLAEQQSQTTHLATIAGDTTAIETAVQIMDDWDNGASDGASVSGDVAHDSADAGEPVKIGMKAYELDGTAPQTAVAEADRVNAISDLVGRQYVATEHPRFWHVSADYAAAQTNASVKAAPGASLALYITDIMISNGATAGNVTLLDGSGGTVLFEIYPAINGGVALNLKNPIKLTDNTALCLTSTTVTTHSVFISGFID